jgi:Ca2+-dependent lipid-binding protein
LPALQRLRIMEFTLDHEAPYFSNMRRRTSRKDSDLNGVVDVRYTGGARMLLLIEVGTGRWRIKIPVMVSDLDLESKLWLKIRLAPMCPWIGTLGLGFVGSPSIKVQLNPYNRIRLMKIPIIQAFLTKLLTVDLPALITLPKRLEINIPPTASARASSSTTAACTRASRCATRASRP